MYYLLKDNRLFDSNDKTFKSEYSERSGLTFYSIETPDETYTHYDLGGGEWTDHTYEFRSCDIKKQSENVFDLIEVGDLIKVASGKIFDVRKPYIDKGLAIVPFHTIFLNEINIIAIYKPNDKGDYIKVWEI